MTRTLQIAHLALALAGAIVLAIVGYETWRIGEQIHGRFGVLSRVEAIETQINATAKNTADLTATLKSASSQWQGETTAELAFVQKELPQLAQDLHDTLQQTQGAIGTVQDDATTLNAQLVHVGPLLDSAKAATDAVPPAVGDLRKVLVSANTQIQGLQTEQADLHRVLVATAGGMENVQGITLDGRKVSDHLEQEIDHPAKQKWYIRILPTSIRGLITAGQVYSAVK